MADRYDPACRSDVLAITEEFSWCGAVLLLSLYVLVANIISKFVSTL